jgi:hypothetical protein
MSGCGNDFIALVEPEAPPAADSYPRLVPARLLRSAPTACSRSIA